MNTPSISTSRWIKRGLIFSGFHSQLPIVVPGEKGRLRIYATRRVEGKSEIFWIEVSEEDPSNILGMKTGVVCPGARGEFDALGAMTSHLVMVDSVEHLYYTGWDLGITQPYHHAIGLAIRKGDEEWQKVGPVILGRSSDYWLCSSPFVIPGKPWRMWFISGKGCGGWVNLEGKLHPLYGMRYAESEDGRSWTQIDLHFPRAEMEVFSRPFVVKDDIGYRMWYSFMTVGPQKRYRIGYAESGDGIRWERKDHLAGIDVSLSGWDAEMVAFPYFCRRNDIWSLFYSGNNFGGSGIGYADCCQE